VALLAKAYPFKEKQMTVSLFHTWFKSPKQSRGQDKRKSTYRPRLEFLENRLAPATLHVGPTAEPYTSIEAAVMAAHPGDTIKVDPGIYHEHVVVDKPLTILGANANVNPTTSTRHSESTVDGDFTGAPFDIAANNVTINGFTIVNGQNGLNAGIATTSTVSGYNIADNIITGNAIGVYANSSGAATIQHNLFNANNLPGAAGGAGIYSDQGTNGLVVTGNEFENHTQNNPIIFGISNGASNTNLTVTDNNLHDNVSGIYALAVSGGAFECNTISTNGTGTGITFGGTDTNIDVLNNNLDNNARGLRIANFGDYAGATANSNIRVHYNDFANDSQYGLGIQDEGNGPGYTEGNLDATFNWWGAASGPTNAANPSGTGSAVVNDFSTPSVLFKPWLVTAVTPTTLFFHDTSGNLFTVDRASGVFALYEANGTVISGTGAKVDKHGQLHLNTDLDHDKDHDHDHGKDHDHDKDHDHGKDHDHDGKIMAEGNVNKNIKIELQQHGKPMKFSLTQFNPSPAC
jgi:nitrous oxidase accessory protein NosD